MTKTELWRTKAVDAFSLVLANDNATESRAFFKKEDSVGVTTFGLFTACTGASVVLGIGLGRREGLARLDCNRGAE